MNDDELAAISALAEQATEGPWKWVGEYTESHMIGAFIQPLPEHRSTVAYIGPDEDVAYVASSIHDAEFVAAARSAVPALVAALAEARAELVAHEKRALSVDDKWVALVRSRESALAEAHRTLAEQTERVEAVIRRYRDYRGGFDQIRCERADFADVAQAALDGDEALQKMTGLRRASSRSVSVCQVCGGRGDMCPHCDGYGECRSACCKRAESAGEQR